MENFSTPFITEIPQAFNVTGADGVSRLMGSYAQLIKHFALYQRYNLQLMPVDTYKVSQIQKNIQRGLYNISLHGGTYKNLFANISFSYPLEWSKICIMVPSEDELPRYWYLVLPFGPYIWTILCLSIPYIALLMTFLQHPARMFQANLLKSLAVVMFCSNMNLKLKNIAKKLQFFYLLLFVMGFIMNSYYCSYLTTYNMRPVFQPFPKTIDDILEAGIKVLVPSHILEELRNSQYVNLTRLEPIMLEKSSTDVSNKVHNFIRSYAYMVTQHDWIFVGKLQRNLIQPLYQLSDICFGNIFNTFPIQYHSKFASSLDYFILLVQQSGLWEQWQEEAFRAGIRANYYRVQQDAYPVDPLNLYFYRLAWILFFLGLILSSLCFVGEKIVFRYWNSRRMYK